MKFTEEKLEEAFIELLGNEGFTHHLGNSIVRSVEEVLIGNYLIVCSLCKYKDRSPKDIQIERIDYNGPESNWHSWSALHIEVDKGKRPGIFTFAHLPLD